MTSTFDAGTRAPASLDWPAESARSNDDGFRWLHARSNLCLDFHGDPQRARLVVFSDGNHHMALEECLQRFLAAHPAAEDVFYVTTPRRYCSPGLSPAVCMSAICVCHCSRTFSSARQRYSTA